jgi:hypothetical protein
MTYAEIKAEVASIIATSVRPLPAHAKAVLAAFMQHTSGLQVIERCPYCDGAIGVIESDQRAWSVSCPCGRSHDTMRGL